VINAKRHGEDTRRVAGSGVLIDFQRDGRALNTRALSWLWTPQLPAPLGLWSGTGIRTDGAQVEVPRRRADKAVLSYVRK